MDIRGSVRSFLRDSTPPSVAPVGPNPTDRKEVLLNRLKGYYARRRKNWQTRRWLQITGGFVLFAAIVTYRFLLLPQSRYHVFVLPIGLLVALGLWASSFAFAPYEFELEIRQTEDELDLVNTDASKGEQDALKLFKIHQLELNKYYDQTLKQSRWIFFVGILCLLLGFGVIGISIWFVTGSNESTRLTAAILGGVGGVLSNFIGAVYLKMHSETIKSLTEFHNRLVKTHYLHFGNFLLAKIEKDVLREESLAKVAINLSENESRTAKRTHSDAAKAKKTSPAGKHTVGNPVS